MKHSDVRNTIVETASELFYKNGYNLTGINEVIKEAGIAKATLYSHFSSKDDLCIAYLRQKNDTFLEAFDAYILSVTKGKKRIIAIFDFLIEFYNSPGFNGCWCINTISEIPKEKIIIRNEIRKQKADFIFRIEQIVANNMASISKKKVSELSKRLYLLYEGAVSESFLHEEVWPIESAKSIAKILIQ